MISRISLAVLALLMVTCALLEGLVETLPPQFIQLNGLLVILCAGIYITWSVRFWFGR